MLPHSLSAFSNKGGVGKSSLTAFLSVSLAESGWRVLVLDLDSQANYADAVGASSHPDWDGGVALREAIRTRGASPLPVIRGVRPNLDVILGGPEANNIPEILQQHRDLDRDPHWYLIFDRLLGELASQYNVILFDVPPTASLMHTAVLASLHYVVYPVEPAGFADSAILGALKMINETRATTNPYLTGLGVVINKWDARNKNSLRKTLEGLEPILADAGLEILGPPIRLSQAEDRNMKDAGRVATELERDLIARAVAKVRRSKSSTAPKVPKTIENLSEDMTAVGREIVARFVEAQRQFVLTHGAA